MKITWHCLLLIFWHWTSSEYFKWYKNTVMSSLLYTQKRLHKILLYKQFKRMSCWWYCLQGQHSSQDEKGTAALKTVELDDELGGVAVQVRVVQGKEPAHFLTIFSGKMIILRGGKASSFDGNCITLHLHNHIQNHHHFSDDHKLWFDEH